MACVAELSTVNAALTSVAVNNTIPLGNVVHQRGTRRGCNGCCNPILDLAGTNSIVVSGADATFSNVATSLHQI